MSTKGGLHLVGDYVSCWIYTFAIKVFTITSGVIGFNLTVFSLYVFFTRGLRFFSFIFDKCFGKNLENLLKKEVHSGFPFVV